MSDTIDSIRAELWEKMRGSTPEKGKKYRDNLVAANLSANIAAQIQALREARGWMQKDLAEKADMAPARISVMENPSYEKLTLSTLKRIASTFDVALIVKFAAHSELVTWIASLSPERLNVPSFYEDSLAGPAAIHDDALKVEVGPKAKTLGDLPGVEIQQEPIAQKPRARSTAADSAITDSWWRRPAREFLPPMPAAPQPVA